MPSNTGYYLKPGVRVSAPGVLFSLVIDPAIATEGCSEDRQFHTFGGADVCVSSWRRNKWSPVKGARANTPEELAQWMHEHADPRRRNWVFAPDAGGALAQALIWDTLDRGPVAWHPRGTYTARKKRPKKPKGGTVIERIAATPRCVILDYTREKLHWVWLGTDQYFSASEEKLAASLGHCWQDTGPAPDHGQYVYRTARERCELWQLAFQQLCLWWRAHAKAPFGLTASALSMGILRSHIQPKALCTHSHQYAHRIEREAAFGGSARTFFYGDIGPVSRAGTEAAPAPPKSQYGAIPGPLTSFDVSSMYPSLLRDREFPTHFMGYREDRGKEAPQAYADHLGVIARVTIETDVPEYPFRSGGEVIYPVGRFTTVLTGPELLRLKGEGKVLACHAMSTYRLGTPFKAAAESLLAMRASAVAEGRPAWAEFAKTVGNGMGGKLAQRKGVWVERHNVGCKERFGEWFDERKSKGEQVRYRGIAGCVWEYQKDPWGAGPYTFAFSYLAAYGRLLLRDLRERCPERSVVSVDTDGLWVLPDAVEPLRKLVKRGKGKPGTLREEETIDAARFLGPRHYFTPGKWVLAGFTRPTVTNRGRTVNDTVRWVPFVSLHGGPPIGVSVKSRSSALKIEARGVTIGKDGWTSPKVRKMAAPESLG